MFLIFIAFFHVLIIKINLEKHEKSFIKLLTIEHTFNYNIEKLSEHSTDNNI